MFGVLVNTLAVVVGSIFGMLLKKGIPERISKVLMQGIALCTLYIGWSGTLKGKNTLVLIISMVVGIVIGELIDLDCKLNKFSVWLERKFKKDNKISIAEGFITASLLFCIGAMTIVGSLQAGLTGNNEMLFTKSVLDLISSFIFASTLGVGVLLSAGFVFVFQGSIVLLAQYIAPILNEVAIGEMTCLGSLIIFALGLNILGITKIKITNFLPAIFIVPLICMIII